MPPVPGAVGAKYPALTVLLPPDPFGPRKVSVMIEAGSVQSQ